MELINYIIPLGFTYRLLNDNVETLTVTYIGLYRHTRYQKEHLLWVLEVCKAAVVQYLSALSQNYYYYYYY
jgi:hypothetical protein